ncbi:MAG: serine hydrolase domain-containing protein [Candidatus Marinimicrobia bacterium]|nr:serine hydrolase domain-containing protein [Candidatus Neomarinimicrobiota bacterium]
METLKNFYILVLLFILVVGGKYTSGNSPDDRATRLVEQFMKTHKMPGLSVTVGKEGKIVWSQGFGLADVKQNIPVTQKTRFRIGSVSKTVTSAAVGHLLDQGKLDLDAPIQEYVPAFPEKRWPITTRQTMGHLAGIRHYRGKEMFSDIFYPNVSSCLSIFDQDTLLHEPGIKFRYSSYGWNLVSAVVEGAAGTGFLAYMEDSVFTALGMETLMAEHRDSTLTPIAAFYSIEKRKPILAPKVDNSYKWAGGGFVGTTADMVNFIHGLNQSNFISKQSLIELQTPLRLNNGKSTNYGLGWVNQKDFWRNKIVGHSGGSIGGRAMLIHYPGKDVTVAILVNSGGGGNLNRLARRIANRFMK